MICITVRGPVRRLIFSAQMGTIMTHFQAASRANHRMIDKAPDLCEGINNDTAAGCERRTWLWPRPAHRRRRSSWILGEAV